MDAGLRMRIAKLPAHLKARASKVQDLHMKFVTGMTNGDPGNDKNGKAFFQSAIKFMQGLAKDPAATSDPAVHEMIHFLANDFGKGDLPTDIPTATLIEGEIGHLKGWAADFRGPRGGDPNRGPQGGPPQGSHGYTSGDGSHGYTSGDGSHGYSPGDGYPGQGHQDHGEDGPSPEDVIAELPEKLQKVFEKTLEVERSSERAHVAAELKVKQSIRRTLESTKKFLATASPDDQEAIARVLKFFGDDDDHNGGGPGTTGMPQDANEMVRRMIEDFERDIEEMKQALQHM